jgi:hypothetical protein
VRWEAMGEPPWKRVFAWWPVTVVEPSGRTVMVWFEWVDRKTFGFRDPVYVNGKRSYLAHRLPGGPSPTIVRW